MNVYEPYRYYIKIRDGTIIIEGKNVLISLKNTVFMIKILLKKVSKNFLKNIKKIK